MNKRFIYGILPLAIAIAVVALPKVSQAASLGQALKGRILIAVESKGEAWYVSPEGERHYMGRPYEAFKLMENLGLGITNRDFESFRGVAPYRLAGKILIKVQDSGKAYYVDPRTRRMQYLGSPTDAYLLMRRVGLGIRDRDLAQIPIHTFRKAPYITVLYQTTEYGNIAVKEVVSQGRGWAVVRKSENGKPGAVLGYKQVADGVNKNIVIPVKGPSSNRELFVVLHRDAANLGIFEYPGVDAPVVINGKTVQAKFFDTFELMKSEVRIGDDYFSPQITRVGRNTQVTWKNDDRVSHGVVMPGKFNTGEMKAGTTYSRIFFDAGYFEYYDLRNSQVRGAIVVE